MDLTWAQRALQVQIDRRATNQKDLDVLDEVERWSAENNNKLPVNTRENKEEMNIAKKLRRLQDKEHLTPILRRRIEELNDKSRKTPTKAAARGAVVRHRARRRIALLSNQAEEHREWCRLNYPALTQQELDDRFQRGVPNALVTQPYPGLANLGNTCYVNAVCQALLHCDAVRNWLATDNLASGVAEDDARDFLKALQNLSHTLQHGVQADTGDPPVRFSVWSPHAFLDAFLRCHWKNEHDASEALGKQHDAREALEEILTTTRMGNQLFDTGMLHTSRRDVLSLPAFAQDGWWYKHFTSERQVINMRDLLDAGFAHLAKKPRLLPVALVVIVPPFAHGEDGTTICLNSEDLRTDWGDCKLDLEEHVAEHCIDRERAK